MKQGLDTIAAKIEKGAGGVSAGIMSKFSNTTGGLTSKFPIKKILIGVIVIAALAGIGYFVIKKFKHKFKFLEKIWDKLPGQSGGAGSLEASLVSEVSEASGGGRSHRHRRRGRRVRRKRHE